MFSNELLNFNTVLPTDEISVSIIGRLHLQGTLQGNATDFGHTTMANVDPKVPIPTVYLDVNGDFFFPFYDFMTQTYYHFRLVGSYLFYIFLRTGPVFFVIFILK
jgi:hypothetical protein